MILKQRHLAERVEVVLEAGHATATYASFGSHKKVAVRYEDLRPSPIEFANSQGIPKFTAIFGGFGALLAVLTAEASSLRLLFASAASLCFGLCGYVLWNMRPARRVLLQLTDGNHPLVVYRDQPTPEAVRDFLKALKEAQQSYLRENYAPSGVAQSVTGEVERLFWLKSQGALTDGEFEQLKAKLLGSSAEKTNVGQYV